MISHDPAVESFGVASTIGKGQDTNGQSEPTSKDETDGLGRGQMITALSVQAMRDEVGKDASQTHQRYNRGQMVTISPLTGWWIYRKRKKGVK